jgi:UTP-glucose-1-phosphate uridylyltransferase
MKATTSPTLLIMAAGMGSRYGGLKQIDPVGPGGETIIDYSIYDALRAGFGKLVFVIRKEIEEPFKEIVGRRFEKRIAVEYVLQELDMLPPGFSVPAGRTKPWGTTHAILLAAGVIDEPFAVINADDFYGAEGYRVLAQHLQSGVADYAMAGFILRNTLSEFGTVARGVCRAGNDGYLESVVEMMKIERDGDHAKNTEATGETTRLEGSEVVSMNMWGFTPRIFPQLEEHFHCFLEAHGAEEKSECYIPQVVNDLVTAGQARVKVLRTSDSWFGVTYREDRPHVIEDINRLISAGSYPERLWS